MFGEQLRAARQAAGLSQSELAGRAGVSRQLVGAAESGRHLPRVDAAVALSRAVGVPVESLLAPQSTDLCGVAGPVPSPGRPVQLGRVGERLVCAPLPPVADGWGVADAVVGGSGVEVLPGHRPRAVIVGCDPAIGLADRMLSESGDALLTVAASTAAAVASLAGGRTHAVVVHGPEGMLPVAPLPVRRQHLARWRVGLAAPEAGSAWWREALAGRRTVVQREPGAGSQEAFARAVAAAGGRLPGGPRAAGHREAARWAQVEGTVGVTIEPAALAAGLSFHSLEEHRAEVWISQECSDEPAIVRLRDLLVSAAFQRRLAAVGGYDLDGCGRAVEA